MEGTSMDSIVVDVIAGLLLVGTTCAMAYLGVHVTIHPIAPEDHKERRRRKAQFIVCGLVIAAVTVLQIVRSGNAQRQLIKQIEDLKQNPPKVFVTSPPATVISDQKDAYRLEAAQLKERAFHLASQIRKLSGEQREALLSIFWRVSAAQGPNGVLTTGTDQEKQNWRNAQTREQQDSFKYYRQKYHDSYMTDATNLRESLLKHLPPGTRDEQLIYAYRDGFGYSEMDKVASDLERLAAMIPD